jgi:hypothetical protein
VVVKEDAVTSGAKPLLVHADVKKKESAAG